MLYGALFVSAIQTQVAETENERQSLLTLKL